MDAMWWRSVAVAFAVFICCWPQAASGQATNSIQQTTGKKMNKARPLYVAVVPVCRKSNFSLAPVI